MKVRVLERPTAPVSPTADDVDLPEGWAWVTIGQASELNPAKPLPDALRADAPVTFVPMPAVDAGSGTIATPQERPYGQVRKGYTAFRDDDVIVAKITPCMENGKAAVARGLTNGLGFGSTEFHVLRPNGVAIPEYLFHYVRQESFRQAAESEMTGSVGQRRVPAEFLDRAPLPLPPPAEQKRIVETIEILLAQVNASRERLARVPASLKRFRQSVLAAACSGRLTAYWRSDRNDTGDVAALLAQIRGERSDARKRSPDLRRAARPADKGPDATGDVSDGRSEIAAEWAWVALSDLLHFNRAAGYGVLQPGPDVPSGVPMVRVSDLERGTVLVDQLKRIAPEIDSQYRRTKLEGGEVLVSLVGTIGRTAVAPQCLAGANIARAVAMLPLCPYVVPRFIQYSLEEASKNAELVSLAREVARKTLNLGLLKSVYVPLPPLPEQHEIVRRVEALFKLADAVEQRVAQAIARAEKLTQAILARAFRGELVPTEAELARREGRDYEPASALFERIRRERAQRTAAHGTSRRSRRGRPV